MNETSKVAASGFLPPAGAITSWRDDNIPGGIAHGKFDPSIPAFAGDGTGGEAWKSDRGANVEMLPSASRRYGGWPIGADMPEGRSGQ